MWALMTMPKPIMSVNIALIRLIYPPARLGSGVGINALVVGLGLRVARNVALIRSIALLQRLQRSPRTRPVACSWSMCSVPFADSAAAMPHTAQRSPSRSTSASWSAAGRTLPGTRSQRASAMLAPSRSKSSSCAALRNSRSST